METAQLYDLYIKIAQWVVPTALTFAIRYLSQIAKRLTEISVSLAVVVNQINQHETRISRLEDDLRARTARR